MKNSERVVPLLLEFVASAGMSLVMYAALLRSGQVFGALGVGAVFAAAYMAGRPNYVAQVNPIVTLGLWMARKVSSLRMVVTVFVQMLGGVAAWQLMEFMLDRPLSSLAGDKFKWELFVAEALGAFIFTFLLSLVLFKNKLDDGKVALIGFAGLFVAMVVASIPNATYGIVNPAIAVGVQSWSWTYLLGPLAGGFVGMNILPILDLLDSKSKKTAKKVSKKSSKKKK